MPPEPLFAARKPFDLVFPDFTSHITPLSERELTYAIIRGEHTGDGERVAYEIRPIRNGLCVVSWQEAILTTVVHVLDFAALTVETFITTPGSRFIRVHGRISEKPSLSAPSIKLQV